MEIQQSALLKGVDKENLKTIEESCQSLQYRIGQPLSEPKKIPNNVQIILSGTARLLGNQNKKRITIAKLGDGTPIGLASLLRAEACEEVNASEDLTVLSIPDKIIIDLYQKDILDLEVDEVGTFDIIASAAVFEHCQDMEKVAYKCFDLLKPNGMMYASYGGPLWYTYGGDHFSGRDNPKNGFNHLLLGKKEYWEYVKANVELTVDSELKAGGGGILVKLDLFSKLSSNEYLELFKRVGFTVKELILEYCPMAVELMKDKKIREALLQKYPNLNEDDFKCKTHIILLEKKA